MIKIERPGIVKVVSWAAGNGDRSENGDYIYGKKKLRQIDSRIKYLIINIEDAEIVRRDSVVPERKIFFGAFVVINDDIKSKLNPINNIKNVHVSVTFDPPWKPEMMTDFAREKLGFEPVSNKIKEKKIELEWE